MMTTPPTIPVKTQKKPMSKTIKIILFVLLGLFVLCVVIGIISTSSPSGKATSTAEAVLTQSAVPPKTLALTNTTSPIDTPIPQSTNTPTSTETQIPPTATYEPLILTGSGDSVVDFTKPFDVGILHITGNSTGRYFGVESYNSNGDMVALLVNTTEPYDGIVPLDFNDSDQTTRFQVKAEGNWTIEILPLTSARSLVVPGTIAGKGDDVITLTGSKPDIAKIKGNSTARYFGVFGYGNYYNLLVNTTDAYDGTVMLQSDIFVLEIKATGDWTIEVTGK